MALIWDFIVESFHELPANFLAMLYAVLAMITSVHTIINKRDARSASGWLLLIWLSPLLGALLYYLFGVNRIRRKVFLVRKEALSTLAGSDYVRLDKVADLIGGSLHQEAQGMIEFGERLTGARLTVGNHVDVFTRATDAYLAMLAAIDGAEHSILLSTYIFANDPTGHAFVEALGRAQARGVAIRVLVDATGAKYSFPTIMGRLHRAGIRAAQFLPHRLPGSLATFNLRNHRKLLIIDGMRGFTGGLNISAKFDERFGKHACQDLHFYVAGPVVAHMRSAFVEDWAFATREALDERFWLPRIPHVGVIEARGIIDGPDLDFEKLQLVFLRALMTARHKIRILTPYFLPDPSTLNFLRVASLGGVLVEILVPERSNIPMIDWAFRASIGPLLEAGCMVYLAPGSFDHSKLFLVDDYWSSFGSANWDARSLKLNFEFNVECYDRPLNACLTKVFKEKRASAHRLLPEDIAQRGFLERFRDSTAELFSPLL